MSVTAGVCIPDEFGEVLCLHLNPNKDQWEGLGISNKFNCDQFVGATGCRRSHAHTRTTSSAFYSFFFSWSTFWNVSILNYSIFTVCRPSVCNVFDDFDQSSSLLWLKWISHKTFKEIIKYFPNSKCLRNRIFQFYHVYFVTVIHLLLLTSSPHWYSVKPILHVLSFFVCFQLTFCRSDVWYVLNICALVFIFQLSDRKNTRQQQRMHENDC